MEMGGTHEIAEANEKQAREGLEDENVAKEVRGGASQSRHELFAKSHWIASIGGRGESKIHRPEGECSMVESRTGSTDSKYVPKERFLVMVFKPPK